LSGAAHRFGNQIADHVTPEFGDQAIFGGARLVSIEVEHLGPSPHPLIGELPPLLRVPSRGIGAETTLSRLASCVISEARSPSPAIQLVQDRLASALVLEAVREALSSIGEDRSVWLAALADPEIGPVLETMLRVPEKDWSVASLAESGAMSRSTFARRFQQLLGCGPMDVLVDIRMRKAGELLKRRGVDLKSIARSIGYRSTAAFSASFKRWCGQTPSDYRQPETGNSLRT
jgi:AraC-like DNA-binding protein